MHSRGCTSGFAMDDNEDCCDKRCHLWQDLRTWFGFTQDEVNSNLYDSHFYFITLASMPKYLIEHGRSALLKALEDIAPSKPWLLKWTGRVLFPAVLTAFAKSLAIRAEAYQVVLALAGWAAHVGKDEKWCTSATNWGRNLVQHLVDSFLTDVVETPCDGYWPTKGFPVDLIIEFRVDIEAFENPIWNEVLRGSVEDVAHRGDWLIFQTAREVEPTSASVLRSSSMLAKFGHLYLEMPQESIQAAQLVRGMAYASHTCGADLRLLVLRMNEVRQMLIHEKGTKDLGALSACFSDSSSVLTSSSVKDEAHVTRKNEDTPGVPPMQAEINHMLRPVPCDITSGMATPASSSTTTARGRKPGTVISYSVLDGTGSEGGSSRGANVQYSENEQPSSTLVLQRRGPTGVFPTEKGKFCEEEAEAAGETDNSQDQAGADWETRASFLARNRDARRGDVSHPSGSSTGAKYDSLQVSRQQRPQQLRRGKRLSRQYPFQHAQQRSSQHREQNAPGYPEERPPQQRYSAIPCPQEMLAGQSDAASSSIALESTQEDETQSAASQPQPGPDPSFVPHGDVAPSSSSNTPSGANRVGPFVHCVPSENAANPRENASCGTTVGQCWRTNANAQPCASDPLPAHIPQQDILCRRDGHHDSKFLCDVVAVGFPVNPHQGAQSGYAAQPGIYHPQVPLSAAWLGPQQHAHEASHIERPVDVLHTMQQGRPAYNPSAGRDLAYCERPVHANEEQRREQFQRHLQDEHQQQQEQRLRQHYQQQQQYKQQQQQQNQLQQQFQDRHQQLQWQQLQQQQQQQLPQPIKEQARQGQQLQQQQVQQQVQNQEQQIQQHQVQQQQKKRHDHRELRAPSPGNISRSATQQPARQLRDHEHCEHQGTTEGSPLRPPARPVSVPRPTTPHHGDLLRPPLATGEYMATPLQQHEPHRVMSPPQLSRVASDQQQYQEQHNDLHAMLPPQLSRVSARQNEGHHVEHQPPYQPHHNQYHAPSSTHQLLRVGPDHQHHQNVSACTTAFSTRPRIRTPSPVGIHGITENDPRVDAIPQRQAPSTSSIPRQRDHPTAPAMSSLSHAALVSTGSRAASPQCTVEQPCEPKRDRVHPCIVHPELNVSTRGKAPSVESERVLHMRHNQNMPDMGVVCPPKLSNPHMSDACSAGSLLPRTAERVQRSQHTLMCGELSQMSISGEPVCW